MIMRSGNNAPYLIRLTAEETLHTTRLYHQWGYIL